MKQKFKIGILIALLAFQILMDRYVHTLKFNVDFLYLILIYISVRSGFLKTMLWSTLIGWVTDFLSGGIVGIFGFSRALIAFLVHEVHRFVDLNKNTFVFLFIMLSLSFSNLVANFFLYFIHSYPIEAGLVVRQPILTAIVGVLLISPNKMKDLLDVR